MSVFLPPTDSLLTNYTQPVTTVTTIPSSSSVLTSSIVSSPTTTSAVSIPSSQASITTIPSHISSTSTLTSSMDSTTSSSSTPSSTVMSSSMQALGGTAGLAGIVVSGIVLIVVIIIATIYFCRRKDGKTRPLSRSESRRSTWAWGSRVGPWRLNVSSMAVSEDRSRKSRHTNIHKEFPEIVVLDARPSTDNSASSLPYVNQPSTGRPPNEINGPLHLTMPYHPETEKEEDLPPERYIPYVAPKQNTRANSTLGQAPSKRVSINPPTAHYNSRQIGTNSVSAAAPPSHRTSLVMTDHVYTNSRQQSHSRSSSTSSGSQSSRTNLNKIPAPLVIPPKGSRHSRYSPHNSPAITEETESELGDEVDLTDVDKNRKHVEEDPQLYLHLKDMGEWDRKSRAHFSKESEIDPAGINSRTRQYSQWI